VREIFPVPVKQNGSSHAFAVDEGVRIPPSKEKMSQLKPSFQEDGVVTAGNSSQIKRRRRGGPGHDRGKGQGAGAKAAGADPGAGDRRLGATSADRCPDSSPRFLSTAGAAIGLGHHRGQLRADDRLRQDPRPRL